jgi:hypothetical protein
MIEYLGIIGLIALPMIIIDFIWSQSSLLKFKRKGEKTAKRVFGYMKKNNCLMSQVPLELFPETKNDYIVGIFGGRKRDQLNTVLSKEFQSEARKSMRFMK